MTLHLRPMGPMPLFDLPRDASGMPYPSIGRYLYRRLAVDLKDSYRWDRSTQRYTLARLTEVSLIASQRRRCDAHPDDHEPD